MQQILRIGTSDSCWLRRQIGTAAIGEEWFYTANRYGAFLGRGKTGEVPEADRYIVADLEAHPKDSDAQMRTVTSTSISEIRHRLLNSTVRR